jgi:hypothetical protein
MYERHGKCGSPEYKAWRNIIQRCGNPHNIAYKYYGGRGISVFPDWIKSFPAFLAHVGPKPKGPHDIARIDNDCGYVPGNVEWQTRLKNSHNRRGNVLLTIKGQTKCIAEWARLKGMNSSTLRRRIANGFSDPAALFPSSDLGPFRPLRNRTRPTRELTPDPDEKAPLGTISILP